MEIDRDRHLDRNFGLRGAKLFVESDEEIDVEEGNKVAKIMLDAQKKKLPWYLIDESTMVAKTWSLFVQFMTWSTLIITPMTFIFPPFKEATVNYEWFVDSVWCLEIFVSFFKGHIIYAPTSSRAMKRYLTNGPLYIGPFWFDVASTIPPMIFKEMNLKANALKFLRLYHIGDIYLPTELLMRTLLAK